MKKVLFFSAVAILFGLSTLIYSDENPALQMQLTKKDGEVQARSSANTQWLEAQIKMMLSKGSAVKTGLDSYAELALNPQNRFRIKQESEVEIAKVMEDSTQPGGSVVKLVDFNLKSGTLLAKLDNLPKGTKLSVGSPTAVAAASGTEFSVIVEGQGETHVAVLENQVLITSVGEANKAITAGRFQRVDVAPWDIAILKAKGTGILSEKILGKKFVEQAKQDIEIVGIGTGMAPENAAPEDRDKLAAGAAHLAALRSLTDRVMDIDLSAEQKIGDLLAADVEVSEKVFRVISQGRIIRSAKMPDGATEEEISVNLNQIAEAVGRPITSVRQTIRPVSLEEYGAQFGPLARVTTRRAAQVDALRKLAEKIYGSVVTSDTTVKDLQATNDKITMTVQGIVQGGEIVREFYFSDGSVSVEVQALGRQVKQGLTNVAGDIFGRNYVSAPERIVVDDFETYRELENI